MVWISSAVVASQRLKRIWEEAGPASGKCSGDLVDRAAGCPGASDGDTAADVRRVRPDEEAALRALVQPVEPIQQPQEGAVLGHWPMQQLINPGVPLVTWSPGESPVVRAVVDGPGPMRPSRRTSRMQRACTH